MENKYQEGKTLIEQAVEAAIYEGFTEETVTSVSPLYLYEGS